MKKTISIVIPTYNEEGNVKLISERITALFNKSLLDYDYSIIFIDNHSEDRTRDIIRELTYNNKRIKAIFNSSNFGGLRSPIYGLMQSTSDCTVMIPADMQDPPEMIPIFVKAWEEGYKVVVGVKNPARENPFIAYCRKSYYRFIERLSEVKQISQFTGFGLYDRDFVEAIKKYEDPVPYIKGLVAEIGFVRKEISYEQEQRVSGTSKYKFWRLYDYAMLGITSNTKAVMRLATIAGFSLAIISIVIAIVFLILKLVLWMNYPMGTSPILIGIFFLGGIQLFFLGLLGEYIMTINSKIVKRPLVIEEERINF